MKKIFFILLAIAISAMCFGQGEVVRKGVNAQTLLRLDTTSTLSNYILTKYRASLLFAPITGSAVYEVLTNKSTATSTSATKYPSWSGAKAYADSLAVLLERLTNKVTTTGTSSTKYMTQGAVKTYGDSIANLKAPIASPTFTGNGSITGTWSTGANAGTSGQINFIASDNDQGNISINTSDALTFTGFTGGVLIDSEIYTSNIDTINTPTFTANIASGVSSRVLVIPSGYWIEAIKVIDVGTTAGLTDINAVQETSGINIIYDKECASGATMIYNVIGDHNIYSSSKNLTFTATGNSANGMSIVIYLHK